MLQEYVFQHVADALEYLIRTSDQTFGSFYADSSASNQDPIKATSYGLFVTNPARRIDPDFDRVPRWTNCLPPYSADAVQCFWQFARGYEEYE